MIDQDQLKEQLRSRFFELISNVAYYSHSQLMETVSFHIQEILHVPIAAIYSYNHWEQTYEKATGSKYPELKKQPFKGLCLDTHLSTYNHTNNADMVFTTNSHKLKTCIIRIQPKFEPDAFLFLAYQPIEDGFIQKCLDSIIQELESLLKIVNYYKMSKEKEGKSTFLFEITTRFYSTISKKNILTEMTKGIHNLYPDFDYNILLSQDYEEESTLPVKTIEYSDDATKRIGTQALITGEVQLEDRIKEKKTYLYAPLCGKQGVYGVLQIITPNSVDFPQKEIEFITKFAGVAGKAIESAALYQNSKHLVEDLKLINDATRALNTNLDITQITTIVRQKIMEACGETQVGFIYTGETENNMIQVLSGSTPYFFTSEGEVNAGIILDQINEKEESLFSGNFTKELQDFPFSSVMAIPMFHGGSIHGVIIIIHENKYAFSFENFKLMQSLVQHFTLSLTNSILNEKLKAVAITDYLTKLYSRNHLEDQIQQHLLKDDKGTLIVVDIDDFKRINDTYGHHIGDEVIIQIASIIRSHTNENDVPARWGGEELAIYLANATIDQGVKIASDVRKQAESITNPKVTLSCGVATWNSSTKADVTDLFIRADKALYCAKKTGKNRVAKE